MFLACIKFKFINILKQIVAFLIVLVVGCWISISICRTIDNQSGGNVDNPSDFDDLLTRGVVALEEMVIIEGRE